MRRRGLRDPKARAVRGRLEVEAERRDGLLTAASVGVVGEREPAQDQQALSLNDLDRGVAGGSVRPAKSGAPAGPELEPGLGSKPSSQLIIISNRRPHLIGRHGQEDVPLDDLPFCHFRLPSRNQRVACLAQVR